MTTTSPGPDIVDVGEFLTVARRRWWMVLLGAAIGLAATLGYTRTREPQYTSYASVSLLPVGVAQEKVHNEGLVDIDGERELVRSYLVAETVAEQLSPSTIAGLEGPDTARTLRRDVIANPTASPRVLEIAYTHGEPAVAREITGTYARTFLDVRADLATAALDDRQRTLIEQAGALDEELDAVIGVLDGVDPASEDPSAEVLAARIRRDEIVRERAAVSTELRSLDTLNTISGEVIEPALTPTRPATAGDLPIVAAGTIAGALLGVAAVWVGFRADRRVGTTEALARMEVPTLGHLAELPLVASNPAPPAPDVALLATLTAAQADTAGTQVIAVASPGTRDATERVAFGLATALARTSRVLVVSGDLHADGLGLALGLDGAGGVTAFLDGDAIVPHEVAPNLDVLPAGRASEPAQLVRSPLLNQLLDLGADHYDLVLVAVPGLGVRPEAAALAWAAGSAVIVAEQRVDTRTGVATATGLLTELGVTVLGAISLEGGASLAVTVPEPPAPARRRLVRAGGPSPASSESVQGGPGLDAVDAERAGRGRTPGL